MSGLLSGLLTLVGSIATKVVEAFQDDPPNLDKPKPIDPGVVKSIEEARKKREKNRLPPD